MKYENVKTAGISGYKGLLLQTVYEHDIVPIMWDVSDVLLRIPHKITAFIQRDKIVEARKTNCNEDKADEFYMVKLVDNTFLELIY